jgi:hypothetical protein
MLQPGSPAGDTVHARTYPQSHQATAIGFYPSSVPLVVAPSPVSPRAPASAPLGPSLFGLGSKTYYYSSPPR